MVDERDARLECRRLLEQDAFEQLELEVKQVPAELHADAYAAVRDGLYIKQAYEFLDPEWCRRRVAAIAAVGRAIERLQSVLREKDYDIGVFTGALEREYRALTQPEEKAQNTLTLSRPGLGWVPANPAGGRPRAKWRVVTEARLVELGVPVLDARNILSAAGLLASDEED